jgi:cell wall-associated NlpC family hydrolase
MDRISLKASSETSSKAAPREKRPANGDSFSRADDRFHLTGASLVLDARIHAYRNDIADIGLAGQIFAPHYARPLIRGCGAGHAFVWPGPSAEGEAVSELLPGEDFAVLEYAGGRAWGYCRADHITGYVEAIALAESVTPTHIVIEASAPVADGEAVDAAIIAHLPMGSRLRGEEDGALLLTEYGRVPLSHLRAMGDFETDFVLVAERLLGAPYLAGGRTAGGIDAAGFVQLALGLAGVAAPRLADQQRVLGEAIGEGSALRRGDLVLFDGGAGLMIDDVLMIHASREAGKVIVEPVISIDGAMEFRRV